MKKQKKETETASPLRALEEMIPREIVRELDRFVVGQAKAKRALAVALRNRYRRRRLEPERAREYAPRNLILIGPTGVGKTEVARRLAQLSSSPFLKIEASKFTEVGYVGRDVESIIDELTETAVRMVRDERVSLIGRKAERNAEERLLDLLDPRGRSTKKRPDWNAKERKKARKKLLRKLRSGKLDQRRVELEVSDRFPLPAEPATVHLEEMDVNLADLLVGFFPHPGKQNMPVREAIPYLIQEEESRLVDMDHVVREAVRRVEDSGIVFLDELDKVAGRESGQGPNVSREGVQRNLLPIVEGTTVVTRYGPVKTDHILFIAAGAFHVSKPSDLIPELQGRFPLRVEMDSLSEADLIRILKEPENSLIGQYQGLLATEGVELLFTPEAIDRIAALAAQVNQSTENIGARRLHTVLEVLLEEVSYLAPELERKEFIINEVYVDEKLAGLIKNDDLSRYML